MNAHQDQIQIAQVTAANFEAEVIRSPQPVLVEFSATWSQPCHILDSVLDEVALACAGKVKLVRINADDNPDLSLWYEIQSVPTLLGFLGGKVRARIVGTASKEAILAKLQTAFHSSDAGFHLSTAPDTTSEH
ncbi:MAG: thiol reductase thioredoxin [Verrucomicrobiae bacterium]|nr:thiol reductase thioredoxin [Verrucomicrobiae bacterium]